LGLPRKSGAFTRYSKYQHNAEQHQDRADFKSPAQAISICHDAEEQHCDTAKRESRAHVKAIGKCPVFWAAFLYHCHDHGTGGEGDKAQDD